MKPIGLTGLVVAKWCCLNTLTFFFLCFVLWVWVLASSGRFTCILFESVGCLDCWYYYMAACDCLHLYLLCCGSRPSIVYHFHFYSQAFLSIYLSSFLSAYLSAYLPVFSIAQYVHDFFHPSCSIGIETPMQGEQAAVATFMAIKKS